MSAEIQTGSRPAGEVRSMEISDTQGNAQDKVALKRRLLAIVAPIMNIEIPASEKNKYKIVPLPPQKKEALAKEIAKWTTSTQTS